jgi:hypothetical protein
VSEAYFFRPIINNNQSFSLTRQLTEGIRHLALDIDYCEPKTDEGDACLCHGNDNCTLLAGELRAVDGLREIRTWMDDNPSEVVTLEFENYLTYADFVTEMRQGQFEDIAYHLPEEGAPFPFTIGDMAALGERLVIFGPQAPTEAERISWIQSASIDDPDRGLQKTEFGVEPTDKWPCASRPLPKKSSRFGQSTIFGLEHVRGGAFGVGNARASDCSNNLDAILNHLRKCEDEQGRNINYVAVDFYNTDAGPLEIANVVNRERGLIDENHIAVPYDDGGCDCRNHEDCGSGEFCSFTELCVDTNTNGVPCLNDEECDSGICDGVICAECDGDEDCFSDEYCTLGCHPKKDAGGTCSRHGQCSSGLCNFGFCIADELGPGSPCGSDKVCASDDCAGLCISNCGDEVCGLFENCGLTNDESRCNSDCGLCEIGEACGNSSDCEEGVCDLASCANGNRGPGAPCEGNVACRSGECGPLNLCKQICGDDSCDGTELCGADDAGLNCNSDCGKCPNGTVCASHSVCSSDVCNFGFCIAGGLGPAAPCSANRACRSNQWTVGFCASICGDDVCEGTELCGGSDSGLECNDDCGKCGTGKGCTSNGDCQSGICNFGFCISGPQNDGSICSTNAACKSGQCTAGICICTRKGLGATCSSNSECCSDSCKSVFGVNRCV